MICHIVTAKQCARKQANSAANLKKVLTEVAAGSKIALSAFQMFVVDQQVVDPEKSHKDLLAAWGALPGAEKEPYKQRVKSAKMANRPKKAIQDVGEVLPPMIVSGEDNDEDDAESVAHELDRSLDLRR
jgi:hypothetical protein